MTSTPTKKETEQMKRRMGFKIATKWEDKEKLTIFISIIQDCN
jgi:hypothetical protein